MNDFDYDAMQKKQLCASARKQKNGCKSRKCSLPSDHLTAAQLRAKSGPVATYDLNEPMSWDAFKAMPADLQVEYIRRLNSRFCVGMNAISRELFALSNTALGGHLRKHGIPYCITGKKLDRAEQLVWDAWLNKTDREEAVEEEPAPVCVVEEQDVVDIPTDSESAAFGMRSLCVEWCGQFDPLVFVEQLKRMVLPDGNVKIRLEVEQA